MSLNVLPQDYSLHFLNHFINSGEAALETFFFCLHLTLPAETDALLDPPRVWEVAKPCLFERGALDTVVPSVTSRRADSRNSILAASLVAVLVGLGVTDWLQNKLLLSTLRM